MAAFLRFHPIILHASTIVSEDSLARTMDFDCTATLPHIQSRITSVLALETTLKKVLRGN